MICFRNPGEIGIESIRTMGASVKADSAIGFFGTGLKYALAILLRTKQQVTISSGLDVYRFNVQPVDIRGKSFDVVTLNGVAMGFTTELGKTWEQWMAYRELYCNALDEGGSVSVESIAPDPEPGQTIVSVDGSLFEAEHHRRGEHFLIDRKPILAIGDIEVYEGESRNFFYKGVSIYRFNATGLYTYNITSKMDLNEDRSIKNPYTAVYYIAKAIAECSNRRIIRDVVLASEGTMEWNLDLNHYSHSPEFAEIALQEYRRDSNKVNKSIQLFVQRLPPAEVYAGMGGELTTMQSVMLKRAVAFIKTIGFDASPYHIRVVETLGPAVMAQAIAEHSEIIVSKSTFDKGTKFLASTLLEEVVHLREGLSDESRALQTYLFDKILSLGEELAGSPI